MALAVAMRWRWRGEIAFFFFFFFVRKPIFNISSVPRHWAHAGAAAARTCAMEYYIITVYNMMLYARTMYIVVSVETYTHRCRTSGRHSFTWKAHIIIQVYGVHKGTFGTGFCFSFRFVFLLPTLPTRLLAARQCAYVVRVSSENSGG